MLWQVIPQPDCVGEEGVEVGIDRGLGDLEITCAVSRHSADWGEIIEWYLDDPGVGFMEGGNFDPGPLRSKRGTHPKVPMFLRMLPGVRE